MENEGKKLCKHCKTEIPKDAKICPNCRKKQGGILKFILIAIAVIIVFAAATSGGDKDDVKKVADTGEDKTQTTAQQDQTEETVADEQKEEKTTFNVGDVAESDVFRITYISAAEYSSGNEYIQPKDGCVFYRVEFEVENKGTSDMIVGSYEFAGYADGYAVDQAYYEDDILSATLSSGKKAKGAVYYEVPKDAQSITVEYETNFWTSKKIVFVVK